MSGCIEFRRINWSLLPPLEEFFDHIQATGADSFFHPHTFTREDARAICRYKGLDLYYLVTEGSQAKAYGLLRGWDEGYEIPSLGIAVVKSERGSGLARCFIEFLHLSAKSRGANKVRLKVHKDNIQAVKLYDRVGYRFRVFSEEELEGIKEL